MQSAKSGVSRVLGLPAKLICVPEASIRGCHVLTVTEVNRKKEKERKRKERKRKKKKEKERKRKR
jgi:hypothetical protein